MPVVLAFDTSQAWCAACLLVENSRPVIRVDHMARGQAEHLMGMLEQVLAGAGLSWHDVNVIGVGTGPGNFTGIRIGVAAARGLAMSLDIPAIGVSAFEAAGAHSTLDHSTSHWVAVDAPRGQVYIQRFGTSASNPELTHNAALTDLDAPLIRACDISPEQRIETIARLTRQRRDQSPCRPAPLYVRKPDAAPPRDPAPIILP